MLNLLFLLSTNLLENDIKKSFKEYKKSPYQECTSKWILYKTAWILSLL